MGRARHLSASIGACVLAAALIGLFATGCGSSESESSSDEAPQSRPAPPGANARSCTVSVRGVSELRATGAVCSTAAEVAAAWAAERGCKLAAKASRGACTVGRYRCLATTSERGLAVSCARPGRSISFVFRE